MQKPNITPKMAVDFHINHIMMVILQAEKAYATQDNIDEFKIELSLLKEEITIWGYKFINHINKLEKRMEIIKPGKLVVVPDSSAN
jgi:hypothetical protein